MSLSCQPALIFDERYKLQQFHCWTLAEVDACIIEIHQIRDSRAEITDNTITLASWLQNLIISKLEAITLWLLQKKGGVKSSRNLHLEDCVTLSFQEALWNPTPSSVNTLKYGGRCEGFIEIGPHIVTSISSVRVKGMNHLLQQIDLLGLI